MITPKEKIVITLLYTISGILYYQMYKLYNKK